MAKSCIYDKHYQNFQIGGKLKHLVLKDDRICTDNYDLKYRQWQNQRAEQYKKHNEKQEQKTSTLQDYLKGNENIFVKENPSSKFDILKRIKVGTRVFSKYNGFGIITNIENTFVIVKYDSGEQEIFFLLDFKNSSKIEICG